MSPLEGAGHVTIRLDQHDDLAGVVRRAEAHELPEPCSGDLDRPITNASDDIDGAAESLNVPADGVHLGDLAVLDARMRLP